LELKVSGDAQTVASDLCTPVPPRPCADTRSSFRSTACRATTPGPRPIRPGTSPTRPASMRR
jgi:hypothetical protein